MKTEALFNSDRFDLDGSFRSKCVQA